MFARSLPALKIGTVTDGPVVPANQVFGLAARSAKRSGEGKSRKKIGRGDANSGGGGVKLRLGAANVGAAQEKLGGQANGNGRGSGGNRGDRAQLVQKRCRLAAQKNAEAVDHLLHILLEQRNARFVGGDFGLGVGDVKAADKTTGSAAAGEIEAAALGFKIALKAAQVHVVESNFREKRHQHIAAIFDGEGDIRVGGLDAAANAAENIQFPRRVEAGLIKISRTAATTAAAAAPIGGRGIDRWP
jgi:hypothetical protein